MKKKLSAPTVQNHAIPNSQSGESQALKPPLARSRPGPTLPGKHHAVSYVPGEKPRREPLDIPRLFIRGFGGSIKMDLSGVGVRLSKAVFAHRVADDCLQSIHVLRGDIVLIEPVFRSLHEGNLVLLELNGRPVLRRLRKENRLWMLDPAGGACAGSAALADHALQGVAVGVVRLFNKLRPVKFEGTDANYSTALELPTPLAKKRTRTGGHRKADPPAARKDGTGFFHLPAPGGRNKFHLNDIDETVRYKAWPDKR